MKILACFAHPDDESFGPSGTLAKATRSGHSIALLTFTRGESGTLGISKKLSGTELADRRCAELKQAAEKLGIQHLHICQLSDKQLQYFPAQKGIEIIRGEIDQFEPDIVITYHENTISGHPDHLAVTKWTLQTVKAMKDPPVLFFYGLDQNQTTMSLFRNLIPVIDSEITHRIDVGDYVDDKIAAIRCHQTQRTAWQKLLEMQTEYKNFARWEVFVQKWPPPDKKTVKHELF